jgi:hypothetical protein
MGAINRYLKTACSTASQHTKDFRSFKIVDHMKKLPPRGFGVTMNPQEKKTKRR